MILIAKPKSIIQGSYRVFRGGCWNGHGLYCRSADRRRVVPPKRDHDLGFRVILRKRSR